MKKSSSRPGSNSAAEDGDGSGDTHGDKQSDKLQLPQYILEVNFELLHSEAVLLTGMFLKGLCTFCRTKYTMSTDLH